MEHCPKAISTTPVENRALHVVDDVAVRLLRKFEKDHGSNQRGEVFEYFKLKVADRYRGEILISTTQEVSSAPPELKKEKQSLYRKPLGQMNYIEHFSMRLHLIGIVMGVMILFYIVAGVLRWLFT